MALLALDWNGTLIDDTAGWAKAYNAALNVLGIAEQPLEELQDKYDTPTVKSILNFGVAEDVYDIHAADMYKAFSAALTIHTAQADLRDGTVEFLREMKEAGHTLFLLSNHHQDDLTRELARCGLSGTFGNVSGRDSQEQIRTKSTKRERLLSFMERGGHAAHDVVIVGDAREEARIAREIGVTCIGITGGYSSRMQLEAERAHHIVAHLLEISPILSGPSFIR